MTAIAFDFDDSGTAGRALDQDPRAAVTVMFAASLVPMVMLLALAIDLGAATSVKSQLDLAANSAALQGLRTATQEFSRNGSANAASYGSTSATNWWSATTGRVNATITRSSATVTQTGVSFTANVSYAATVPSTFSGIFAVQNLPISGRVSSTMQLNAYTDVDMLIDNSSSMLIASTSTGIASMEALTPCYIAGNLNPSTSGGNDGSGQSSGNAATTTNCPRPNSASTAGIGTSTYTVQGTGYKQVMSGTTGQGYGTTAGTGSDYGTTWGYLNTSYTPTRFYPYTTSLVCGFACHWDGRTASIVNGERIAPRDFYTLARDNNIQLRFDVVQSAAAQVINQMITKQNQTGVANQFGTGIYMFNTNFTRVYPSSGESGTDLNGALTAVQAITTPVVSNDGDTYFPAAMTTLASTLTAAGDGSSTSSRKKNLFIITDGIQDYSPRTKGSSLGPITPSTCATIKSMGINIWVLYTTYTPLPNNSFYVTNIKPYVESPPTPATVVTNLQGCASAPNQFYQANDPASITTAMSTMLAAAASQPGRITQ